MIESADNVPTNDAMSSPHDTQEAAAEQFESLLTDLGEEKNPAVGAGQNGEVQPEKPAVGEQVEQIDQHSHDDEPVTQSAG